MYGIYEVGSNEVYVFMGQTTYHKAYFFDLEEACEVCASMNKDSNGKRHYEVREV